jgi:hypothetical protein
MGDVVTVTDASRRAARDWALYKWGPNERRALDSQEQHRKLAMSKSNSPQILLFASIQQTHIAK